MKSWNAPLIELIGGSHIRSDEDARIALIELLRRVKRVKLTKWQRFRAAHRQENPLIYRVCIPHLYIVYKHLQGKRYMCACNDMEDVLYSMERDDIGILVNIIKVLEVGLYVKMEVPWHWSVYEVPGLRWLAIAEKEGYVPKLPFDWWYSLELCEQRGF